MKRLVLLAAVGVLASSPVAAQTCDPFDPDAGAVRGRVVADATGKPVGSRAVSVVGSCVTITRNDGTFILRGVLPGTHRLGVAPLGFRPHAPVRFVLSAADTADVGTIRLRPENRVADCLEEPECAALLRPDPAAVRELSDDERLEEAVLRTALALAPGARAHDWVVACAPATNPRVFAALAARLPGLVPDAECALPGSGPGRMRGRLTHTPTGRPAISVALERIDRDAATATAHSSFYVAPLHAMGWKCGLSRDGESWTPQWCRMTWIS